MLAYQIQMRGSRVLFLTYFLPLMTQWAAVRILVALINDPPQANLYRRDVSSYFSNAT
jgi:hypothetical protein